MTKLKLNKYKSFLNCRSPFIAINNQLAIANPILAVWIFTSVLLITLSVWKTEIILGSGFLSALLLAVSVKSAQTALLRARQHEKVNQALEQANQNLEVLVRERTAELVRINTKLQDEIAERKRSEQAVATALEREGEFNDLKSRIITTISHEYRTPLTVILSSTDLIQKYWHKLTEEQKLKQLSNIKKSARHMTDMMDDVIFLNQAEINQLTYDPFQLNLRQFTQELIEQISYNVPSNMTVDFQIEASCDNTYLDPTLIKKMIINLFSNAIKYSPKGGTIRSKIDCADGGAQFLVQDEGLGIPEAEIGHIFDFFYRASNVGNISGTGLGLAVVKKCVDLHQGSISVKSVVNRGTTFTITLPCQCQ